MERQVFSTAKSVVNFKHAQTVDSVKVVGDNEMGPSVLSIETRRTNFDGSEGYGSYACTTLDTVFAALAAAGFSVIPTAAMVGFVATGPYNEFENVLTIGRRG